MDKRKKQLRELEKQILESNNTRQENEVTLENSDFKDGKLSWSGFKRLRDECEYIDYEEDIEIKLPKQYMDGFKETLESMTTNELLHIRKDTIETRAKGALLFIIGVAILALGLSIESILRQEIFMILSWVFVWAAAEKIFFDRQNLQDNRYNLLHILSAKITSVKGD